MKRWLFQAQALRAARRGDWEAVSTLLASLKRFIARWGLPQAMLVELATRMLDHLEAHLDDATLRATTERYVGGSLEEWRWLYPQVDASFFEVLWARLALRMTTGLRVHCCT